jgi:hypothetical protein
MRKVRWLLLAVLTVGLMAPAIGQATPLLTEWAVSTGMGTTPLDSYAGDAFPGWSGAAAFLTNNGVGTLQTTVSAGSGYIALFLDHDLGVSSMNSALAAGSVGLGQSWQIGIPFDQYDDNGDLSATATIFGNFANGSLSNAASPFGPDDVSWALAWNYTVPANYRGRVNFIVSDTAPEPAGLFYLSQTDGNETLYFYSTFATEEIPSNVPEPATLLLMAGGLGGMMLARVRSKR